MIRKLLFLFFLAVFPIIACAEEVEIDGINYDLIKSWGSISNWEKASVISKSNGYSGDIIIPETVTYNDVTYSVTSIGNSAFENCSGLTSVIIPSSVTSIGNQAFLMCSNLISVIIPESVTNIGYQVFSGCSSLPSVIIPSSVTTIGSNVFENCINLTTITINSTTTGKNTFYGCSNLTSVILGNSVEIIGEYAFSGCSSLPSVVIPNSVEVIGGSAFGGCTNLTSLVIPNSVTSIGGDAFEGCSGLTTVTIGDGVTSIGGDTFYGCSNLVSVTLGNSVTSIGIRAFKDCGNLASINIPNSVTSIGNDAFENCGSLASINFPNSLTSIGDYAFYGCIGLTSVVIPNSVTSIGRVTFFNCSSLSSFTFGNSVTSIGLGAFGNCSSLTSINIPNSVTSIGGSAFSGCNGLTSVTLGTSVEIIGEEAFKNCSSLTSVVIPNSVTNIGRSAFEGCSGLTTVTIGDGVTSIGGDTFYGCSNLVSVTLGNSVTSIEYRAFQNCSSLTSVIIPNSVTDIGNSAFYGCSSLTSITIPNNVKSIEACSFENCSSLASVIIPESVTSIGESAFKKCSGLTSVIIPESVTSIGEYAFNDCSSLTSVIIPNSVTSIKKSTFAYCKGLTSVILGNSVESIGEYAFNYCSSLTYINFPNSLTSIGRSAFDNCSSLTSVVIPNSVTSIGENTFDRCISLTSVVFPNSVTIIEKGTFDGCKSLASVILGNSVTSIKYIAFRDCLCLTNITLGNSVTSIEERAFENCVSLTSVVIPNSVTSIEGGTFYGCGGLTSVVIPNSVTTIGSNAFYGCSGLISLTIPNSVTNIGEGAFKNCISLPSVNIPESVTSIERYVFEGCKSLTSVTLGNSVKSIGLYAFRNCSSLTSLVIPNSVTNIGNESFMGCKGLTTVTLGKSVKDIYFWAFEGCRSLSDVYCLSSEAPTTPESTFDGCDLTKAVLHVPSGCVDKYADVSPWSSFKIVEIEGDFVSGTELRLSAQEEDGLVRLQFNAVPGDLNYCITRTDKNGVNVNYRKKESHFPDNVEFVDTPPTAGTYIYSLTMAYLDNNGEKQEAKSNTVTVTIEKPHEETVQEYGFITGRIECDKYPPVSGLKVSFSDDVTVNARGTIFSRQKIPVGTVLTMTVSGDEAHDYEPETIQIQPKLNTVTIKGTLKEGYMPNENTYDLNIYDLEFYVEGGKHHVKFTLYNPDEDHTWVGSVSAELIRIEDITRIQQWRGETISSRGEVTDIRIWNNKPIELDIVMNDMTVSKEAGFYFYLKSKGQWQNSKLPDAVAEKPIITRNGNVMVEWPVLIEKTHPDEKDKWDSEAQEDFSYLMLGLGSITPGMKGNLGNFSNYEYKEKMVAFAKDFTGNRNDTDAIKALFEWLSGKTALETLNEISLFNASSLTFNIIKELKNIFLPQNSIFQKFLKDVIIKTDDIKSANAMLGNIISVFKGTTSQDTFQQIMQCASAIYGLTADKTVPLGSMMYTYMVAGEKLINAAKSFAPIMADAYLSERLRKNQRFSGEKTGDNEHRYNTAIDFKIIVKTGNKDDTRIDFRNWSAQRQIENIYVTAENNKSNGPVSFIRFYKIWGEDGIILECPRDKVRLASNLDVNTPLYKFYIEIHWANDRITYIPLDEGYDGIDIDYGNATNSDDNFEKYKPLSYTITLTTATGEDNMADELYLGSNKKRK